MASIIKRPNSSWRARYRDDAGREHAKHFARKVDAQDWLDGVTASLVRGDYVSPRAAKTTLRAYAERWRKSLVAGPVMTERVGVVLRLHVLPVLGDRPMSSIKRSDVQGLVRGLSEHLAPSTVRLVTGVLSRLFDAAVDDQVVPSNPCRRVTMPKATSSEVRPPTPEEVAKLAAAMPARRRALVWFLAGSGLRIAEALGLDVEHVDFLRRTVRVERQAAPDGTIVGRTKGSRPRTVPLGQVVIDVLAAYLAEYPSDGPLFTNELGGRLEYWRWRAEWAAVAKRLESDCRTHDLRHFCASALIAGGASVPQVQAVLGHATPTITLNVYGHLWPGDEDRTRAVMDAVLAPVTPSADSLRTADASGA